MSRRPGRRPRWLVVDRGGPVGGIGVDAELPGRAHGPVTTTVTRRIKPGHEAAYEGFLAGISGAARAFPGYLGVEVFRPTPGQGQGEGGEYRTVYRFDSVAHLQAWAGLPPTRGLAGPRPAPCRRAHAHPDPHRPGELVHPAHPARCPAAARQDGPGHLGDDLPADHPGRGRHRPAARKSAAADLGGDAPGDRLVGRWLYPTSPRPLRSRSRGPSSTAWRPGRKTSSPIPCRPRWPTAGATGWPRRSSARTRRSHKHSPSLHKQRKGVVPRSSQTYRLRNELEQGGKTR
jgi:heme-degrading monooxygenase HmoA